MANAKRKRTRTFRPLTHRMEVLERRELLATIEGTVFDDANGNQRHDPFLDEAALAGWTTYLDSNNNGRLDGIRVEPDEYRFEPFLDTVHPAVTLQRANENNITNDPIKPVSTAGRTTGNVAFGHFFHDFADRFRLHMDFTDPVQWVAIDFKADHHFGPEQGALDIYDENDTLLASYTTQELPDGDSERMFLARPQHDIAYAVAYSLQSGFLDNLEFSGQPGETEPIAITDENGDYAFEDLSSGTYHVGQVQNVEYVRTVPVAPETHEVELADEAATGRAHFGNASLDSALRIDGRLWHDANGDGTPGVGLNGQNEPGLEDWRVYADSNSNGSYDPGEPTVTTNEYGHYELRVFRTGLHDIRFVQETDFYQTWPEENAALVIQVSSDTQTQDIDMGARRHTQPITHGNILVSRSSWGQADMLLEYGWDGELIQSIIVPDTLTFSRVLMQDLTVDQAGNVHIVMRTDQGNYLTTYNNETFTFTNLEIPEWDNSYTEATDNNITAFENYLYLNDQTVNDNEGGIIRIDTTDMSWERFSDNVTRPYDIHIGRNGLLNVLEYGANDESVVNVFDPKSMEFIRTIFLPERHNKFVVDEESHIHTGGRDYDPNGSLVNEGSNAGGSVLEMGTNGNLIYAGGSHIAVQNSNLIPNTRIYFDQGLPADLPADSYAAFYLPPVSGPPRVESVEPNFGFTDPPPRPVGPLPTTWDVQKSAIRTLTVVFSKPIQAVPDDFVLVNLGIDAPNEDDERVMITEENLTIIDNLAVISFEPGQLPDGVYQLYVLSSVTDFAGVALDGNGDGVTGDPFEYVGTAENQFYQLAGDWNGDGGVTIFDFNTFAYWFGTTVGVDGPAYADLNGDNGISVFDMPMFAERFGDMIVYESFARQLGVAANDDDTLLPQLAQPPRPETRVMLDRKDWDWQTIPQRRDASQESLLRPTPLSVHDQAMAELLAELK